MLSEQVLRFLPTNRAVLLKNINCPYCGCLFQGSIKPTKEHVIGRRFVPKGTLDGQWNLILNACAQCNTAKADLENDISAITKATDLNGNHIVDDVRLRAEAARKSEKAISRRAGKAVAFSQEEIEFRSNFGPAELVFNLHAPPQIDAARVYQLARFHVDGFFFFISYDLDSQRGGYFLGEHRFLTFVRRPDWGNAEARWFMEFVRGWDTRLNVVGADGFFRAVIRRRPTDPAVWAWAVEWNHDTRVLGFAGDPAEIDGFVELIPHLTMSRQEIGPNEWVSVRVEDALSADVDCLFEVQEDAPDSI